MASLKQKLEEAGAALASAKEQLAMAQRNWDELFKQATAGGKSKRPALGIVATVNAMLPPTRAVDRIESVLCADAHRKFSYQDIADRTDLPVPSVKALLYRMKKAGKALRVGRGRWQAAQPTLTNLDAMKAQ